MIIIHYDLDYFYAQVEERDNPNLKGVPVVVGGKPGGRSVVTTANYEARKFGIKSGMATTKAYFLCSHALFIEPSKSKYSEESKAIQSIVKHYSDSIDFVALDEGYLDVTHTAHLFGGYEKLAKSLQKAVFDKRKLTLSIGVGYNKFSAKIACEKNKPNGYAVFKSKSALIREIWEKPVRIIPGVGKKMALDLEKQKIHNIQTLYSFSKERLIQLFGERSGTFLHAAARGGEKSSIGRESKEPSYSQFVTFEEDTYDTALLKNKLIDMIKKLAYTLEQQNIYSKSISLKVKYADFSEQHKSLVLSNATSNTKEIYDVVGKLFAKFNVSKPVRGIGMTLSKIVSARYQQIAFDKIDSHERREKIHKIILSCREKYGYDIFKESIDSNIEMVLKDRNGLHEDD